MCGPFAGSYFNEFGLDRSNSHNNNGKGQQPLLTRLPDYTFERMEMMMMVIITIIIIMY